MVLQLQLVLLTAVASTSTKLLGTGNGPGCSRLTFSPPGPSDTTAPATVSGEPEATLNGSPFSEEAGVCCLGLACGVPVPPSGPRPFAVRAKVTLMCLLAGGAGEGEAARVAALVCWEFWKRRHGFLPYHLPGWSTRKPWGGLGSVGQPAASAQLVNGVDAGGPIWASLTRLCRRDRHKSRRFMWGHTTRLQGIACCARAFGQVGALIGVPMNANCYVVEGWSAGTVMGRRTTRPPTGGLGKEVVQTIRSQGIAADATPSEMVGALIGMPINDKFAASCLEEAFPRVSRPPSGLAVGAGDGVAAKAKGKAGMEVLRRGHGAPPCHFQGRCTARPPTGGLVEEGEHPHEPQGTTAPVSVSCRPGVALIGPPVNARAPTSGPRPFAVPEQTKATCGRLASGAGEDEGVGSGDGCCRGWEPARTWATAHESEQPRGYPSPQETVEQGCFWNGVGSVKPRRATSGFDQQGDHTGGASCFLV